MICCRNPLKEVGMEVRDMNSWSFKRMLPSTMKSLMIHHGRYNNKAILINKKKRFILILNLFYCYTTTQIIDACLPMEDVEKQMKEIALECVISCQKGKPLSLAARTFFAKPSFPSVSILPAFLFPFISASYKYINVNLRIQNNKQTYMNTSAFSERNS